jgi:hypothetical protein
VNALDGNQLNFYMDDKSSLNGFILSPLATTNPLRVSLKPDSDTFAGDFSMLVSGHTLFGSINAASITRGTLPATGLTADFSKVPGASQDWSLAGVLFTGLKNAVFTENNTKLVLPFAKSIFEGQILAQGAVGAGSRPEGRFHFNSSHLSSRLLHRVSRCDRSSERPSPSSRPSVSFRSHRSSLPHHA